MIRAYDEKYVGNAQIAIGDMLHFASYDMGWVPEKFWQAFISTGVSKAAYLGEPRLVVGMSGAEIAYEVYFKLTGGECITQPNPAFDRTPEYFAGWALAYYSWYRDMPYDEIDRVFSVKDAIIMYEPYHEMDVMQFVDVVDKRIKERRNESALRRLRIYARLTQKQLAERSGVSQRMIEQYEQGRKDIGHASADTVYALSRALGCGMEMII